MTGLPLLPMGQQLLTHEESEELAPTRALACRKRPRAPKY
ncbi:hypothetical protein ABIB49_003733 [Arthrobacter sp. UYCu512]